MTGYSHPRCYLSADRNCSEDISRAHFISESILEIINELNGGFMVSGFPWLKEPKDLPPGALASNVLCRRHNVGLSGLDAVALRFYRYVSTLPSYMTNTSRGRTDKVALFNGGDFERWMIKVLCGLLVSGNAAVRGEKVTVTPPAEWLDLLLGRRRLQRPLGLSVINKIGDEVPMQSRVGFAPLFDDADRPVGALMYVDGIGYGLELVRILQRAGTPLEGAEYRPAGLLYEGPTRRFMFNFAGEGWDGGRDVIVEWQRGHGSAT